MISKVNGEEEVDYLTARELALLMFWFGLPTRSKSMTSPGFHEAKMSIPVGLSDLVVSHRVTIYSENKEPEAAHESMTISMRENGNGYNAIHHEHSINIDSIAMKENRAFQVSRFTQEMSFLLEMLLIILSEQQEDFIEGIHALRQLYKVQRKLYRDELAAVQHIRHHIAPGYEPI